MALALVLSGCGPQVVTVTKTPGYSEKITDAAVVLVNTKITPTNTRGGIGSAPGKSLSHFYNVATNRIPALAERDRLAPPFVTTDDAKFARPGHRKIEAPNGGAWPRHFVTIIPYKWQTTCTATCRTEFILITNVYDSKIDKEVWSSSIAITEKSGIHNFDEGDIEGYWSMLVTQLKESGLK